MEQVLYEIHAPREPQGSLIRRVAPDAPWQNMPTCDGLGVLEENRLLGREYPFPELADLSEDEEEILLDAATVLFLEHNVCFRETLGEQTFLVFPSLINEKRPKEEGVETVDDVAYRAVGAVENVYASLVVLLGYTNTFVRHNQWQNRAQYELGQGEICGFRQTDSGGGQIELVLYYAQNTRDHARRLFRGLFERFLSRRDVQVTLYQPVVCPKCQDRLATNVVMERLEQEHDFSFCNSCGKKLRLPPKEALTPLAPREEEHVAAQQVVARRRTAFEAGLVRVKGLRRDRGEEQRPTCFISYAWGVAEHQRWVVQLAKDLQNAGVGVLLDRWHCPPGAELGRYIDQITASDYVLVVGTRPLRQKYEAETSDPVIVAELQLVNLRLQQPKKYGRSVIPLLVEGNPDESLPPQLEKLVRCDFRDEGSYFVILLDLIWRLFGLPFNHPLLEDLRAAMSPLT